MSISRHKYAISVMHNDTAFSLFKKRVCLMNEKNKYNKINSNILSKKA